MQTKVKNKERPFEMPEYNPELLAALRPTFNTYHYKFTLLLPLSAKIIEPNPEPLKRVFQKDDFRKLQRLFDDDFWGFTSYKSIKASIVGHYLNPMQKLVINEHALYEIYTQRHPKAIAYF